MKRVGIDLDGTVANYLHGAVPLLKEYYGLEPDFSKPVYTIEEVFGLTEETRPDNMRKHLYEDLHLFRHLPMLERDTHQLSWEIQRTLGAKVYFITARSNTPVVEEDTLFWLTYNGFTFDDVFFTKDKAQLCREMKVNVMIEDEIKQLVDLITTGIDVVIPNQPWNDLPLPNGPGKIVRIDNWREAFHAVEEYLK